VPTPSSLLPPSAASVASVAADTPDLSTLLAAVKQVPKLATKLSNDTMQITVLAPTNAAFAAYLKANNLTAEQLLASPSLGWILKQHIIKGAIPASAIKDGASVKSWLPGSNVTFSTAGGGVTASTPGSKAKVTKADVAAGAGIVHVIDAVLVPPPQALAEAPAKSAAWKANKAGAPAKAPTAARKLAERP